jgi:tight adherence protein C
MTDLLNLLFSQNLLKVFIFLAGPASIFMLVYYLFPDEEYLAAQKRLGVEEEKVKPKKIALLRWSYPLYSLINSLLPQYAHKRFLAWAETKKPRYQQNLIVANIRDEMTPDDFVGFKILMAVFIPILVFYFAGALGYSISPWSLPMVMILGFYFPDLWLREKMSTRKKAILRALPYTLDLLTLSVEAGMDFIASIQRLTQRTQNNPMVEEFNHMLKEIRLGTSRSDALRSLSNRLEIEEVSSFTTLLIQADQLGASIGDVLRAQSDQLRTKRFQNAEAAGARASQMILFPLIFCIFPAVFIVIMGPTVLNFMSQGILK